MKAQLHRIVSTAHLLPGIGGLAGKPRSGSIGARLVVKAAAARAARTTAAGEH